MLGAISALFKLVKSCGHLVWPPSCSADYADRFPEAFTNLGRWSSEGRIIRKFHVVEGLEKAPESLPLLFSGGNIGKLVVHVSGPGADFKKTVKISSRYLLRTSQWHL
ncbi:hypothetical protein EDB85DRAFT_558929 [Lactarius pseudohatsudake]|nr:hypothetical protein EDB85DRAFT_558929 [Lactarius pseudohatsudake]